MKKLALYFVLLFTLLCSSCATIESEQNNRDPYESYNRAMFSVNQTVDEHFLEPVTVGYTKVVPSPVRTMITNVFNNFRDVISLGSNILRLDVEKASIDLVRVGFNTTFGLGGMMGLADLTNMPNNKNTLGDTFVSWGWKNSNYFVMPILGPSTLRDASGTLITTIYSPESFLLKSDYVYYSTMAVKGLDLRSGYIAVMQGLDNAAIDKYAYIRDIYMGVRSKQTGATLVDDMDIDIDDLVGYDDHTQVMDIDNLVEPDVKPIDIDDLVESPAELKAINSND